MTRPWPRWRWNWADLITSAVRRCGRSTRRSSRPSCAGWPERPCDLSLRRPHLAHLVEDRQVEHRAVLLPLRDRLLHVGLGLRPAAQEAVEVVFRLAVAPLHQADGPAQQVRRAVAGD